MKDSLSQTQREDIIHLVDAICAEEVTQDQMDVLREILRDNSEARTFYHLQIGIHRDLEEGEVFEQLRRVVESDEADSKIVAMEPKGSWARQWRAW